MADWQALREVEGYRIRQAVLEEAGIHKEEGWRK
jgi:hypothetical protein